MANRIGRRHIARELWRARVLIVTLTRRELRARYRGSVFGYCWTLLNPLMLLGIYTLVFSVYIRMDGIPAYPVFLCTGLLPWLWFSGALTQGTTTIVRNHRMITHSAFPPQILPTVDVLASMINCVLSVPVLLCLMWLFHLAPGPGLALLPVVILLQCALTLGMVLAASALTVFYRDVQFLIGNFLIFWMFLTPGIMYSLEKVLEGLSKPDRLGSVWGPRVTDLTHYLNPMAPLIACWQGMLYGQGWPPAADLLAAAVHAAIALHVGLGVFARYRYPLVEEI